MNMGPIYQVAVQSMPAVPFQNWFAANWSNLANTAAAIAAMLAAGAAWKTQKSLVEEKRKEEALKKPVIQASSFTIYKHPAEVLDKFYLSQIQVDLYNIINEPLIEFKYGVIALDQNFKVMSEYNTGTRKAKGIIGNIFPIFCAIGHVTPNSTNGMIYLAIHTEAIDHRKRKSDIEITYYSVFNFSSHPTEMAPGEIIQEPSVAGKIEAGIKEWKIKGGLPTNKAQVNIDPFS